MRNRHSGAALLAVAALLCAPQAQAADQSFPVRAGDGSMQNFAARIVGGLLYPIHLLSGMFGGTPTPISVASDGTVNVNCTSGCSGGGGSLSAKANAASQTSTEGATTDPLSMDLNRYLRVRAIQDGGAAWTVNLGTLGGAATAANQATGLGYLSSLVTNTTGLATSTLQTSGNTKLDSLIAAIATLSGKIDTLNTNVTSAVPAGTALIGKVGVDQTTPGTTNGVQDAATGSTASAVPAKASYAAAQSGGNLVGIVQANASAFLNMTTATTTKIITGASSKKVYITAFRVHAGGTTTAKFVEGTGTNCGTGTADLSETWDLTASDGSNQGNGLGPVLVAATAGDDVCVLNGSAVNLRVGVAYEIH